MLTPKEIAEIVGSIWARKEREAIEEQQAALPYLYRKWEAMNNASESPRRGYIGWDDFLQQEINKGV